jgi:hypothetical protein
MRPLSEATAKLFAPLYIPENERLLLAVDESLRKFAAHFWQYRGKGTTNLFPPCEAVSRLIERIPEKKKLTAAGYPCSWEFAATDYTVEIIASLFPKSQLTFDGDIAEEFLADDESVLVNSFVPGPARVVYQDILQRSVLADYAAECTARFKENGEVPEHSLEYCAEYPLSAYQQVALYNCFNADGYNLFMEPGTGKTPVSIAQTCNQARKLIERLAIERAASLDAAGVTPRGGLRVFIGCPNNVRMNWEKEFLKFSTVQGKITVLRGYDIGRVKQLIDAFTPDPGDMFTIVISGYETMSRSWDSLRLVEWDLAILDEIHCIRNTRTKRFKTAMELRDRSDKRIGLTGTPICNTIADIYGPLEFSGRGNSGFSDFEPFRKFYCKYEMTEGGGTTLAGYQNLPFMQERLARYSFMITKKEALPDLPDKMYDVYEVEMSPEQTDYYHQLATQLAISVEQDLDRVSDLPRSMVVNNALVKLLRLAQITSGFVKWGEVNSDEGSVLSPARYEYFFPNPKIEALLDILSEKGPDSKTLIWACFKPDIAYISHALTEAGRNCVVFHGDTSDAERKIAEDRFNGDVTCTEFVGNAGAGGVGLNLLGYIPERPQDFTTNCDHIIYYSQNWSPVARWQSEDRGHRRGTRVPVRITDLVVPETIDEEIRQRVMDKSKAALEITDIRQILRNVLKHVRN